MARSVLDIVIRTIKEGGADKETVQGLVSVKKSILDAAAVGSTLVAAGYAIDKAFDATVGTLVEFADKVRRVQNATGATAEDSSKLIQILNDQKISYEQLEKAIAKSSKAYDFSINGIANMSEAYLKLGSDQERAAFMQERFGKAWIDFVPIMQQGKDLILEQADAVKKGQVINQDAIDQTREYEIALDNWNDAIEAAQISIGTKLLPAVTNLIGGGHELADAYRELTGEKARAFGGGEYTDQFIAFQAQMERGVAMTKFYSAGLKENSQAALENAAAIKEVSAAHQSMLGLIVNVANENKNYADKQAELTQKMQENRAEAEALYPWQTEQLAGLNQKYAEMSATYDANAAAHNAAMNRIQYDLLVTKLSVDGITDAEFTMIQQAGLMFGVFDQASVTTASNMNAVAEAVNDGRLKVEDMGRALELLPKMKSIDVVINALVKTASDFVTGHEQGQGMQGGFDKGGISTGPTSGHMELLHGTEAVIPLENGSIPVQMQGAPAVSGGNSNINVQLTISSPITILDQQTAQTTLMPFIINGVREAKARGAL